MPDTRFSFQRLNVYQVAKQALALTIANRRHWAKLPGEVAPQLERAMVSTVLNIVEGAGRVSRGDQRRHYQIAGGSACEVMGCLEIAALYGELPEAVMSNLSSLLDRVVAMLTVLGR